MKVPVIGRAPLPASLALPALPAPPRRRVTRRLLGAAAALALAVSSVALAAVAPVAAAGPAHDSSSSCRIGGATGATKHVIYLQFDNVHFTRDNPNVPSDLEQMPHLLNFLTQNGTLLTNHHTPLIAHTATDILTSLTGVYGDRMGVPISNSYRYFNPDGTTNTGVSFAYWTDPIFDPTTTTPTDTKFNMLAADGKNAPAPWVPFTRAGCAVGSVATANTILENIATDIPTVFGPNSPEAAEVAANPAQATADFVGIGIHCPQGAALCSGANNGKPDVLPDEPGGYNGFNALYGNKYVAPQISSGSVTDLFGNVVQDATGHVGFPGFDGMTPAVTLGYVADMQEHGVPVTYGYISDAHDRHPSGPAYGPGEAGYVAALKSYDDAFGTFMTRMAGDGITPANSLFVVTADEGDHFAGGAPSPANCNGVTIPCTYSQIGEINANLAGLLATEQGITTPFKVHSDSAPNVYITGNPSRTDPVTRTFERGTAAVTATNPYTGATEPMFNYLADPVEMKLLHMVTADPARTPTFTAFAKPDYFVFAGAPNCNSPCVSIVPTFAWNHGDVSPDINTTFLGLVGPGVRHLGVDNRVWTDHTDTRPTMLSLVGLADDYRHDGRVITEVMTERATPRALRPDRVEDLGAAYKQLDAAVGRFGLASLHVSTVAVASDTAGDAKYAILEGALAALGAQRDQLATQISSALEGAAFRGQRIPEWRVEQLTERARFLTHAMEALAASV